MPQPLDARPSAGACPKNHSNTRHASSLWGAFLGIQKPVPEWQGLTR
jgi:hypothetical protein